MRGPAGGGRPPVVPHLPHVAGNLSDPSLVVTVTVDRTPPAVPEITSPATGTITSAAVLTLGGTAPADATSVRIFDASVTTPRTSMAVSSERE